MDETVKTPTGRKLGLIGIVLGIVGMTLATIALVL